MSDIDLDIGTVTTDTLITGPADAPASAAVACSIRRETCRPKR
jgi:hypothetical protein